MALWVSRDWCALQVLRCTSSETAAAARVLCKTSNIVLARIAEKLHAALPAVVYICRKGSKEFVDCLSRSDFDVAFWHEVASSLARYKRAQVGFLGGRLYVCSGPPLHSPLALPVHVWLQKGRMVWAASAGSYRNRTTRCSLDGQGLGTMAPTLEVPRQLPALLTPRYGCSLAVLDGVVYVVGGMDCESDSEASEFWDSEDGAWKKVLPSFRISCLVWAFQGRLGKQLCVQPPRMTVEYKKTLRSRYVRRFIPSSASEGQRSMALAERFNSAQGRWEQLPPMMEARGNPAATALSGKLYVCGGHAGHCPLRSVERFDPAAGMWEQLPAMRECRAYPAVGKVRGCIVVYGGFDANGKALESAERFEPDAGEWVAWTP